MATHSCGNGAATAALNRKRGKTSATVTPTKTNTTNIQYPTYIHPFSSKHQDHSRWLIIVPDPMWSQTTMWRPYWWQDNFNYHSANAIRLFYCRRMKQFPCESSSMLWGINEAELRKKGSGPLCLAGSRTPQVDGSNCCGFASAGSFITSFVLTSH